MFAWVVGGKSIAFDILLQKAIQAFVYRLGKNVSIECRSFVANCSILAVNDNLENKLLSPLKYYRYFSLTRTWPHALHLGFNCWSRARHPVWRGGGVSTPSCPVDYRSSTRVFTYRPLTPFGEATVDWKEIIKKGIRYVSSSILFLNNFPSSISSY